MHLRIRIGLNLSCMVRYTTVIKKFGSQGEKTGWTYIEIPAELADKLYPGNKTSFTVKGKLDEHPIKGISLLPMGGGSFIMALNAAMRKAIGKRQGYTLEVSLERDTAPFKFNEDFIACLEDEPAALEFFNEMPLSHRKYFSKWIDSGKSIETKTKRITMAVKALAKKMNYAEMIRSNTKSRR